MMVSLIKYIHFMCNTTSQEQEAAVELGRENGKAVMMLQHHTRNTEQKQWDETLTIALNGMNKVLRSHLPAIVVLEVSGGVVCSAVRHCHVVWCGVVCCCCGARRR